jgi:hypothetical protein
VTVDGDGRTSLVLGAGESARLSADTTVGDWLVL